MKRHLIILLVMILVVSLMSMSTMAAQSKLKNLPRNETLYINGLQWGPPSTFNPLAGSPAWPIEDPAVELVYETLFAYNMANQQLESQLATSYHWTGDLTLKVILDDRAKWQNGNPVTAEDVVYTFKLADRYPLNYSNVWNFVDSVKALDDNTVQFKLNPDNPNRLLLLHQLGFTRILPKAVFQEIEDKYDHNITEMRKWKNRNPVGSGPYTVATYSNQKIVLQRDNDYWGTYKWGKPAPKYVVHVIYKSNDSGNRAFEKGQVDVSQQFIPQVWKMWENKDLPVSTWYNDAPYYLPGSMPSLIINTTKSPTNDLAFRRALAYAINYKTVAQLAMTKYSETMKAGLIMPKEKYFDKADVEKYGWEYNPEKAKQILENNGYKKGPDGYYQTPDGKEIKLTAQCPYGWTDWMVSLKIVAQSARKIGLNIRAEFPEQPVWNSRLQHGKFDLIMNTPGGQASPAQPWLRFRDSIYSVGVAKVGEMAFRNWGRFHNDRVDELITKIPGMTDDKKITAAYKELNQIFMKNVPIIPLEYRPWLFHTWSEKYWTGFPNVKNPYAPPQVATFGAGIRTLFKIKPVKQ